MKAFLMPLHYLQAFTEASVISLDRQWACQPWWAVCCWSHSTLTLCSVIHATPLLHCSSSAGTHAMFVRAEASSPLLYHARNSSLPHTCTCHTVQDRTGQARAPVGAQQRVCAAGAGSRLQGMAQYVSELTLGRCSSTNSSKGTCGQCCFLVIAVVCASGRFCCSSTTLSMHMLSGACGLQSSVCPKQRRRCGLLLLPKAC